MSGTVQGVGFRPFVYRIARELELDGWVENTSEGVRIEIEGSPARVDRFLERLRADPPRLAVIERVESRSIPTAAPRGFRVRESPRPTARTTLVPPDLATCAECLREMRSPSDRRYRYPFLNCTNCGPRFSIIEGLPYDRERTSMRRFPMCRRCREEYVDPENRRFHAEPTACAECGPALRWASAGGGDAVAEGALAEAIRALDSGEIVAVKGLGGYQLVVDATNETAVARLRERKRRGRKPFAVMYPGIVEVEEEIRLTDPEKELLASPAAPIVIAPRRKGVGRLAPSVAPGNPNVGVMVPYTPLHHLLLAGLRRPIVATSGNRAEEPISIDDAEARDRLGGLADSFLHHDRVIVRPVDDSVVRVVLGRPQVLRRARGYAPQPIGSASCDGNLLAVGPLLKATVAATVAGRRIVSQHLGDLDNPFAYQSFERAVADLTAFYAWTPELIAHDLHPEYRSTRFALRQGVSTLPVQHHYAHVLSAMADDDLSPPVLGVAWDGTGFGTDGTIWGGEFLRVDGSGYERRGHLRTFPLPGGDSVAHEPRRSAAGLLFELNGAVALDPASTAYALAPFAESERGALAQMLRGSVRTVRTSSAGRLFDAAASILGLGQFNDFEGDAPMRLEFAALEAIDSGFRPTPYDFEIVVSGDGLSADWAGAIRGLQDDRRDPARAAARFHETLAALITAVADRVNEPEVVLTGGCFQNVLLTERTVDRLTARGFRPHWHSRVPPNDGGIALGQLIAAERVKVGSSVPENAR